jgi:hypothetical protein
MHPCARPHDVTRVFNDSEGGCPDWFGLTRGPPRHVRQNPKRTFHSDVRCSLMGGKTLTSCVLRNLTVASRSLVAACNATERVDLYTMGSGATSGHSIACGSVPSCAASSDVAVVFRRRDAYNVFHAHESLWALWSTFLAYDLLPCKTTIILTDDIADDERSFASGMLQAFASRVVRLRAAQPLCFPKAVTVPNPDAHFTIPYHREDKNRPFHKCGTPPWLTGFARFMFHQFRITPVRDARQVVFLRRAFYRRADNEKLGHSLFRMLDNERALVSMLAREARRSGSPFEHHDPAAMSAREQVEMASRSRVLVGTHSAAFTLLLYMQRPAAVLELSTPTDYHYKNMAGYLGIRHYEVLSVSHKQPRFVADIPKVQSTFQYALASTRHIR